MWVQLFHHLLSLTSIGFSFFVRDIYLPSLKLRSEYYRLKGKYLIIFPFAHVYYILTQLKDKEGLKLSQYTEGFRLQAIQH